MHIDQPLAHIWYINSPKRALTRAIRSRYSFPALSRMLYLFSPRSRNWLSYMEPAQTCAQRRAVGPFGHIAGQCIGRGALPVLFQLVCHFSYRSYSQGVPWQSTARPRARNSRQCDSVELPVDGIKPGEKFQNTHPSRTFSSQITRTLAKKVSI